MKDFKEYENKGLTGLANVGNTCYLNSFVQILSHTYELSQLLEKGEYKKKLNQKKESKILLILKEKTPVVPDLYIQILVQEILILWPLLLSTLLVLGDRWLVFGIW